MKRLQHCAVIILEPDNPVPCHTQILRNRSAGIIRFVISVPLLVEYLERIVLIRGITEINIAWQIQHKITVAFGRNACAI